jgi:hypothetical protein
MFGVEGTTEDKHSAVAFPRLDVVHFSQVGGASFNRDKWRFTVLQAQRQKPTGRPNVVGFHSSERSQNPSVLGVSLNGQMLLQGGVRKARGKAR